MDILDPSRSVPQECQAIGIAGDDIEKELRQVAAGLPAAVEEAAAQLQNPALQQAVDHYKSFCAFTAPSSDGAAASVPLISALSPDTLRLHLPAGQSVGDDRIGASSYGRGVQAGRCPDCADFLSVGLLPADPDERTIGDSHSPDDEAQIDWGVDEAAAATPADTVTNDANRMAVGASIADRL